MNKPNVIPREKSALITFTKSSRIYRKPRKNWAGKKKPEEQKVKDEIKKIKNKIKEEDAENDTELMQLYEDFEKFSEENQFYAVTKQDIMDYAEFSAELPPELKKKNFFHCYYCHQRHNGWIYHQAKCPKFNL